jgi:hypothetical protein
MTTPGDHPEPDFIPSAPLEGFVHRRSVLFRVVAVLLMIGGVVSTGYSLVWFAKAQAPKADLARLQAQREERERFLRENPNANANPGVAMFNMFLGGATGFGTTSIEVTAELAAASAMLDAEKRAYRYLSLALFLGFSGILLFLHSPRANVVAATARGAAALIAASARQTPALVASTADKVAALRKRMKPLVEETPPLPPRPSTDITKLPRFPR